MTDEDDTVRVLLPSVGRTIPVKPYDITTSADMDGLVDVMATIASDRVAMDGFDYQTARMLTVADLAELTQAILPTNREYDDD
jgi:hypothetical protein